ncbi:hypothetical protein [Neptunicella sp. SCSIO 80796]|uniref:hypothetical protein n=1 Tax=Neptunicella plasticusilytica TaxID=3117012 RepID=UPI003A4DE029
MTEKIEQAKKLAADIEKLQEKASSVNAFSAIPLVKEAAQKQAELNGITISILEGLA